MAQDTPDTLRIAPSEQHQNSMDSVRANADFVASLRAALKDHGFLREAIVVNDISGLPVSVQRHLVRQGIDLSKVKGAFAAGQSYIVSKNLESLDEGVKTALHEVVGHAGIRALLGNKFELVMRQLYDGFPREHAVWKTTEQRYGYLDSGTLQGCIAFAEELTACMAETAPEMSEFAMIKAEIRAQFREQFPELPMEEWELHALIQRSREALILRHGEPAAIEELQARLSKRFRAVDAIRAYQQKEGGAGPDPLSLALYSQGSRVLDADGLPTRLYHGAGGDTSNIKGTFWGSTSPSLANEYAEMRLAQGRQASVVPYYADIKRPFDGDPLAAIKTTPETPDNLTVSVFVDELIRQADLDDVQSEALREQGRSLRVLGRMEESGPTYSPQDFWYQPHMMFGVEGAALLKDMFAGAGFDGIRYTEQGTVSYGAFSSGQLHFLDQGASLRGWQPDREHGVGRDSQAAFEHWFGQSHAVDAQGRPLRLFHGTAADFTAHRLGRGAIYTTPDTEIASIYAMEAEAEENTVAGPNVMPVYLSLQNPLVLDEAWAVANLDQDGEREWTLLDEILYRAEQQGHDGAILRGVVDYSGVSEGGQGQRQRQVRAYDQYIAFRPEQVKSALTNVGSFGPMNPDIRFAIHAYHGSPHKFTEFDMSKVNSGEGNQTFGHGLYFASMEAVASAYLYAGKGTRMQLDGRSLLSRENIQTAKTDAVLNRAVGYLSLARDSQLAVQMAMEDERPEVAERLLEMLRQGRITKVTPGHLYEVVLSPNESDLLDWDAPIEEQSPSVLLRLGEAGVSLEPDRETLTGQYTGKDLYQALVMRADEETFDRQGPLWDVVKDDPNRLTYSMDAIASRYLASIGVPGLRYYDGDSRISGGGSRNYVMFDDKLIEIADVRYRLEARDQEKTVDGRSDEEIVPISAFHRWFGNSAVVDGDGNPMVVFHGTEKAGFTVFDTDGSGRTAGTGAFFTQTRLGAKDYAGTQNDAVMIDRDELLAHPERYDVTIEIHGSEEDGWEYIAFTPEVDGAGGTREEALEALADNLENDEAPGVYPVYLSLQNPMIVDCHHSNWDEIITDWAIVDETGETVDFIYDPARIEPYLAENPHHSVENGNARNSNDLAREAREMGFDGLILLNVSDEGPHGQGYAWDDVIYVAFKPEQVKSIYNVGSYDPATEDIRFSLAPRAEAEYLASPAPSAFERWFGESVVKDAEGQPIAVYHGSPDIRGIIEQGFQRSPSRGDVYFFSDDYQVANTYANDSRALDYQNAEPYTAPFYLSLKNPYVIDGAGQKWRETERHIAEAHALGHDGIIIRNSRDEYNHIGNGGKPSTVYAVFDPKQIGAAEPRKPLYSRIDRKLLGNLAVLDRAIIEEAPASLPPLPDIPALTVLHGSESEFFETFKRSCSNDGFFFSQSDRLARGFAWNHGHIIEAQLNIKRPADLRSDPDAWEGFQQGAGLLDSLARQGFDGAVYLEPPGDFADGTELVFVAFDAEQIKVVNRYPANVSRPAPEWVGEQRSPGNSPPLQMSIPLDALALEIPEDPYILMRQRGETLPVQQALGRSALHALIDQLDGFYRRRLPVGVASSPMELLGAQITRDLAKGESVSLLGREVRSPGDLAVMAQVYRDPRFETLRFIALKDLQVVGETAVTSRLPASVNLPQPAFDAMRQLMADTGANSYYLVHNHPSGNPAPSDADIAYTKAIAAKLPGCTAHVVIDYNRYAMILPSGDSKVEYAHWLEGKDFKANPAQPHPALGQWVFDTQDAVEIAKTLNAQQDHAVVIATDAGYRVSMMTGVPMAFLDMMKATPNPRRTMEGLASMRLLLREAGAGGGVYLALPDDGVPAAYRRWLMQTGLFSDVVTGKGMSLASPDNREIPSILSEVTGSRIDSLSAGSEPRLSFAGEAAVSMDTLSLNNAKRAELSGVDPEAIRQATGWFRGAEGRWRFEIDDSQAALKPQISMLGHAGSGPIDIEKVEHKRAVSGQFHVSLTPKDAKVPSDIVHLVGLDSLTLEQLLPSEVVRGVLEGRGENVWGDLLPEAGLTFEYPFKYHPLQALALSEVLEHPALFKAYPILNDVLVKVDPALGNQAGFGFEVEGAVGSPFVITLGKHQQLSSLLHELQHCVQLIEGFAPGGTPRDKTLPLESAIFDRIASETQERIYQITESQDYKGYLDREFKAAGKVLSRRTGKMVQANVGEISLAADELFGVAELRSELKERLSSLQSEASFLDGRFTAYRCLAGEVEARNVQSRLKMRGEERLAISPTRTQDVSTRDQLVRSPLSQPRAMSNASRDPSGTNEALMAWFDDSKIVDDRGAPLRVYHGTCSGHDSFDTDFVGSGNGLSDWGEGFYFTDKPGAASTYAEQTGGNVRPVYLNIRNPATMEVMLSPKVQLALDDDMGFTTTEDVLASLGYDGICIEHKDGNEYIVFSDEQIRSVYDPAFFTATPQREKGVIADHGQADDAPRYSFAGVSSRTAPRMQLENAQQALKAGIDPEVIRQETGWHRGAEGRWRFEIDDSRASVRYGESTSSNTDAYIDWTDEAENREKGVLLGTVLDHPDLFEAYPQLKAYRVKVRSPTALNGAIANFERDERTINMVDPFSMKLETGGGDPVKKILLHELQHAVQAIEGFASGGSIGRIRQEQGLSTPGFQHRRIVEDAEYIATKWRQGGFESIDDFVAYVPCANFDTWQDASIALAKDAERLAESGLRLKAFDSAPRVYQRLAGEVEARNVERRSHLTKEERRSISPESTQDVPKDLVMLENPKQKDNGTLAKYQHSDAMTGEVINFTQGGRILQEAALSMVDILPDSGLSVGWLDGGCRVLAEALVEWSGGKLNLGVTQNRFGNASHAVAVLAPGALGAGAPGLILDGDGVCLLDELYDRLRLLEHSPNEQLAAVGQNAHTLASSLPMNESALCNTVRALEMHLGSYENFSRSLVLDGQKVMVTPRSSIAPENGVHDQGVGLNLPSS